MDFLVPKYRRNPNEKIVSIYSGIAPRGRTVTTIIRPSLDRNRLEATRVYDRGLPRGQGGRVAVLVLGGMETTLDEMEYLVEAKKAKKFVPRRTGGEIAAMCQLLQEHRNEQIMEARKLVVANPSMQARAPRRKVRLHLPVGFRYLKTSEPGLRVLGRV